MGPVVESGLVQKDGPQLPKTCTQTGVVPVYEERVGPWGVGLRTPRRELHKYLIHLITYLLTPCFTRDFQWYPGSLSRTQDR